MKVERHILYTIICIALFAGNGCSFTDGTTIYSTKNLWRDEPDKVIKKAERTKIFGIDQYKDSIFPNALICNLKTIERLTIDNIDFYILSNDPKLSEKHKVKPVVAENMLFNAECLDSLTAIKFLWMGGFKFNKFPIELSRLSALEELWLTFCEVPQIPTDLRAFKKLKKIHFELYSPFDSPDSLFLPNSLQTVEILTFDMNFTNRVKLVKAILRNPQVEKAIISSNDIEETCIIYNIIKANALNEKVYSVPLSEKVKCNQIENRDYKYN